MFESHSNLSMEFSLSTEAQLNSLQRVANNQLVPCFKYVLLMPAT